MAAREEDSSSSSDDGAEDLQQGDRMKMTVKHCSTSSPRSTASTGLLTPGHHDHLVHQHHKNSNLNVELDLVVENDDLGAGAFAKVKLMRLRGGRRVIPAPGAGAGGSAEGDETLTGGGGGASSSAAASDVRGGAGGASSSTAKAATDQAHSSPPFLEFPRHFAVKVESLRKGKRSRFDGEYSAYKKITEKMDRQTSIVVAAQKKLSEALEKEEATNFLERGVDQVVGRRRVFEQVYNNSASGGKNKIGVSARLRWGLGMEVDPEVVLEKGESSTVAARRDMYRSFSKDLQHLLNLRIASKNSENADMKISEKYAHLVVSDDAPWPIPGPGMPIPQVGDFFSS